MILTLIAGALAVALFLAMVVLIETGRRIGQANLARDSDGMPRGAGAAEAAVFGLLGLLLAFTFSSAAGRFQDRKDLIRQEVNAIGTAYLRIDILPAEAQPELRRLMRRYLEVRIVTYADAANEEATQARLDEGAALQGKIWTLAVKSSAASPPAMQLMLPALNDMFDITTTRVMASRNHPPVAIFLLLSGMCLVGALLIGYDTAGNKERIWVHTWSFAAVLALCVYVIIDLEYPRLGLIQVGGADQILIELRDSLR